MNFLHQFEIDSFIYSFYFCEYMYGNVLKFDKGEDAFLKSHEKFTFDLLEFKNKLTNKLAQVFYDYLIYAICRELRHCFEYAQTTPTIYFNKRIYNVNISDIINNFNEVNPKNILEVGKQLFKYDNWYDSCNYGGEPWRKACFIAEKYGKISSLEFVDTIIDLQHNSGSILNKEGLYRVGVSSELDCFLKAKAEYNTYYMLCKYFISSLLYPVFNLLERYINLYGKYDIPEYLINNVIHIRKTRASIHDLRRRSNINLTSFSSYKPIQYECNPEYFVSMNFINGHEYRMKLDRILKTHYIENVDEYYDY